MERVEELCCYYVALIRSIYLVHQNHHWITKGKNFYGNHLLFERIYKSATEDADLAAEKFTGLFGTDVLDLNLQAQMIGKIMGNFASGDPIEGSLKIEKKFLDFSEKFYNTIKDEGKMTLGLDDMIMAIASNREGAVYLLKQAITASGEDEMNSKMAARVNLLKRFKKAQSAPASAGLVAVPQDLLSKLQTTWNAIVLSYVQGQYNERDITVHIDTASVPPKIMANAKLPKAIAPELQQKMENNFKANALQVLPENMKNSMIAVGFSMPPAKALPSVQR